jgi:pimeloyl-ACP methyl ester carboxylesterase
MLEVSFHPGLTRRWDTSATERRWLRLGRRLAYGGGLVLALAVVTYLAVSSHLALTLSRPERQPLTASPAHLGLMYETVSFPSRIDNLPLDGWLLSPTSGAPSRRPVIMVHDRGTDMQRGVFGHILSIASHLVQQDHPVLLFDLRGSGRSAGERFTLGLKEVRDVGGAIDYLQHRGLAGNGVNLLGYSMGAATSLLLAPKEPLVRAVAEDSGYGDLGAVVDGQVPKADLFHRFFAPGTILMAQLLLGLDIYTIRPIDGLSQLAERGTPLLVIHGNADSIVPVSQGRSLASAYGPRAETFFVPGAEHLRNYERNPAAYAKRVAAFFVRAEDPAQGKTGNQDRG